MPLPQSIIDKYSLRKGMGIVISAEMFLYRETKDASVYFGDSKNGKLLITIHALNKQYSTEIPFDVAEDTEAVEKAIKELKDSVN